MGVKYFKYSAQGWPDKETKTKKLNDEEEPDKQRSGIEYLGLFDQHVRKALSQELVWQLGVSNVPKHSSEAGSSYIPEEGDSALDEVRPDNMGPYRPRKEVWILC